MTWAFDADVLIYAASPGHHLGEPVWQLLRRRSDEAFGSVFLVPELLIKAVGSDEETEIRALTTVIARIQLIDVSLPVAALAVELGAAYALRPADAVHLASAVWVGAESFVTNNKRDFRRHRIAEIDVVFPEEL